MFIELSREAIVSCVDAGGIVDHHWLEAIASCVDAGGIVDHHWLEAIVSCVDVGGIVDHHCFNFLFIIYFYIII